MNFVRGIVIAAMVGATFGSAGVAEAKPRRKCDVPPVVAHRGGMERYAENSLPAYRYLASRGIRTWDVDIRFDRNGVPVLMHDATLSRTTTTSGYVRFIDVRRTSARLQDGEPIPTLDAFLRLARKHRARVFLEMKTAPGRRSLARIRKLIARHRLAGRVLFNSFAARRVDRIRSVMGPDFQYGWIVDDRYPSPKQVLRHGRNLFLVDWLVTEKAVQAYRSRGIRVYPWTLDHESQWRRVRGWPVAGVVTDRPVAYTQWRKRVCAAVRNQPHLELR